MESFEAEATQLLTLKIKAKDPAALKADIEQLLAKNRLKFDLRASSKEELHYDVRLPIDRKTDRLSEQLVKLDPELSVEWEEKKEKK